MINEFENSICFIVGVTRRMIVKRLNDALLEHELPLTFDQFVFLYKLYKQPQPVTQQNMADLTGKDKSAVLRTINILEKKNLVLRTDDEQDRRKKHLSLSGKCDESFDDILGLQNRVMEKLKEGISERDYEVMVNVMYKIQANAGKPL